MSTGLSNPSEEVGRDHVMATINWHSTAKKNEQLYEQNCDGRNRYVFFDKVEDIWLFEMVSCDSPCIKLATYRLSLRGES